MGNGAFWNGMTMQHQIHKNPPCLKVVFACVRDSYLLKYLGDEKK